MREGSGPFLLEKIVFTVFPVKSFHLFNSFECQLIFRFQGKRGLIKDISVLIHRCEIMPGTKMGLGFVEELGQGSVLARLLLVSKPNSSDALVGFFIVNAVFFNGRILPQGRLEFLGGFKLLRLAQTIIIEPVPENLRFFAGTIFRQIVL